MTTRAPRRRQDHDLTEVVVPIDTLEPHPENPNVGDLDVLDVSVTSHGQYRPIIVQRSRNRIIAGHHTWMTLKAKGASEVKVNFLDVDDDQAREIMVIDNESGRRGRNDPKRLADVLASLQAKDRLAASGFTAQNLDDLLLRLEPVDLSRIAAKFGGTHNHEDVLPTWRVRVEAGTLARLEAWWDTRPGTTDEEKALGLLDDVGH